MQRYLWLWLSLCLTWAHAQPSPYEIRPQEDLGLLLVDNWTTDEGLPSNYLTGLCQSRDGYVWMTSYSGLARYDGHGFFLFDQHNSAGLATNALGAIAEGPDGTLWMTSTGGGLISYKNGRFASYGADQGITRLFSVICIDKKGRIWSGSPESGWFYFQNGQFFPFFPEKNFSNIRLSQVAEDAQGRIWLGTESDGLFCWDGDSLSHWDDEQGLEGHSVWSLHPDAGGSMWVGTDKGLFRIEAGKARREENLASAIVSSISADAHGNLWVGTNQGLWVRPREADAWLSVSIGQEGNPFVQGLLPDQEGNIWFMRLKGGLSRLKKGKFLHYTDPDSELGNVVNAISPYGPGRFLVAFEHGAVGLLENGSIKPFPLSTPLSGRSVKGILYDSRGTLWISTYAGLLRITKDGRETLYDPQRDFPSALIRLVFEDAQQGLWVGTRDRGLLRIDSDGRVLRTIGQSEGLGENLVLSVGNGAPGQLLVGTSGAGLAVVRAADGHVLAQHHQGTGFPSDVVFSARLDPEGRIWAATNAGLAMVDAGGQYRAFSEKNGLPNNNVYDVLEDAAGRLWLPSAKGAIRIAKQALLQEAPPEPEAFRLYDRADGLREPECNATSKALIDAAGHLWFPTVNGVASLDPRNLLANLAAPPVYVQGLWVDGDTLVPHISMSIGPEAKHFRFDFAALYFYAPQKVRFRYRLLGFETEWQEDDAQTRRAVYTNLGPGKYEFQVIAANDEGVWNNQGDVLAFSVGAHFYERWWFWVLAIGALIAGIAWAYQARLNALQARQAQLEGLVKARTQQLQEHNATLEQQREEISAQRDEIEQQHRHVLAQQASIEASIRYAQRIQEALLPRERALVRLGLQGFILFKPRDVVSGDFYWVEPAGDHIALAAADCTGHGVPGAFMSMLGVAFLNDVVKQRGIARADEVLNQLRSAVKQALRQETRNGETYDGMDMAFCLLHLPTGELRYAGAHNALCIVRSAEAPPVQANRLRTLEGNGRVLYELLPDKQPIGVFLREKPFQEQVVKVLPGDLLYLYSDGYYDQIGGDSGRKLMSRHFKQLLLEVATLPLPQQRVALQAHFEHWQGAYKQVDDVVVMGVQLPGSS